MLHMNTHMVTDMMERTLRVPWHPQRIISLVPSQTELLYDLGVGDRVVGLTKFCVHPQAWYRTKTRVGGTKQLNHQSIAALQPDLIIANKEENTQQDIEQLARHYPVWISDIYNLEAALQMIQQVGTLVAAAHRAADITSSLTLQFQSLPPLPKRKFIYLIWQNPTMVAAQHTFINSLMEDTLGWTNAFHHLERYPVITNQDIATSGADTILLSSEPYPFKAQHITFYKNLLPEADVRLVDGEMFSWYGSRLLKAPPYFLQQFAAYGQN